MPKDHIRNLEIRGASFRYVKWVRGRRVQRPLNVRTRAEAIALIDQINAGSDLADEKIIGRIGDAEVAEMIGGTPTQVAVMKGATPLQDIPLERLTASLSHGQKQRYVRSVSLLRAYLKGKGLPETLEAVDRQTTLDFVAARETEDGPSSVAKMVSVLRALWSKIGERQASFVNPWEKVKVRGSGNTGRAFEPQEARKMLDAFPEGTAVGDASRISALTGMRLEEVMNLRPAHVIEGVIHIRKSKTEAGLRRVPVSAALAPILARLERGRDDPYIDESINVISDRFGRKLRKLGLEDLKPGSRRSATSFHSWRHTAITAMLRAGIAEVVVKFLVGHKPKGVTWNVYGKAGPSLEQLRAAVEALRLP